MELRPIRTKREYQAALGEAEHLWEAPDKSPKAERLEMLVLLIKDHERKHFPIQDPDPIDFLHQVMESRRLTRKDIEPFIGSRARCRGVESRATTIVGDDSSLSYGA